MTCTFSLVFLHIHAILLTKIQKKAKKGMLFARKLLILRAIFKTTTSKQIIHYGKDLERSRS